MKTKLSTFLYILIIIVNFGLSKSQNLKTKIEEYMTYAEKAGFSGSILVAKDKKIIIADGYGAANKNENIPFTKNTVSTIGSITKQFTGAAILKLQMMGKINVKDPITKYFKDVPENKRNITLHHLLTHTAGFPGAIGFDFNPINRKEFVKLAMNTKLKREPGKLYEYSNVGYSLLGIIVELVSNISYEEFLHKYLFKPSNMLNTGYRIPDWDKKKLAHGYRGNKDWGTLLDHPWLEDGPGWHLRGNGGILSTVIDMFKWHLALEKNTILDEKSKKLYYKPHVREGKNAESFYGYGWAIFNTKRNTKLIVHNGGNPYFSADFLRYIDENVVIIVLANTNSYRAWKVSEGLAKIVFGYDYKLPKKPKKIELTSNKDKKWGFPDSITGQRSAAILSAIDSQDLKIAEEFVKKNFALVFLKEYSLKKHVEQFKKLQEELGNINLLEAQKTGEYSVILKVKSKKSGNLFQITFEIQSKKPHKITGIGVDTLD